MQALPPTVDIYLKIAKQIERFSQLSIKLNKVNANSTLDAIAAVDAAAQELRENNLAEESSFAPAP